jgi:hypothetical protein
MEVAYAADWFTHSLVGSVPAFWFIHNWFLAFLFGFVSHAILDRVFAEFRPFPFQRYWLWIILQPIWVLFIVLFQPAYVAWGVIGSIIPDVIDGFYGFAFRPDGKLNIPKGSMQDWLNNSCWMVGKFLFPFHRACERDPQPMTLPKNIVYAILSVLGVTIASYTTRKKKK